MLVSAHLAVWVRCGPEMLAWLGSLRRNSSIPDDFPRAAFDTLRRYIKIRKKVKFHSRDSALWQNFKSMTCFSGLKMPLNVCAHLRAMINYWRLLLVMPAALSQKKKSIWAFTFSEKKSLEKKNERKEKAGYNLQQSLCIFQGALAQPAPVLRWDMMKSGEVCGSSPHIKLSSSCSVNISELVPAG